MKAGVSVWVWLMLSAAQNRFSRTCAEGRRAHKKRISYSFIPMMRRILAGALAFWLAVFSGWAAASTRDLEREAQIEKELGQIHPELVGPFRAARIAFDTENYAEAGRLLREITAKAPDYDVAFRRLGSCLVREGKRAEGLALCERAVALNRSSENLSTLAYNLAVDKSGDEHRADCERALQLLRECRTKPRGTELDTLALTAQVALGLNNRGEIHAANALLAKKYPNELATHYFGAVEAALEQHWLRAEKEIRKAEKLGLTHEAAQKFLDSGIHSRALWSRVVLDTTLTFGF